MDTSAQSFHYTAYSLHFLLKLSVILLDVLQVLVSLLTFIIIKLIVHILLQQLRF